MRLWVDDVRAAPLGWIRARTVQDALRLCCLCAGDIEEVSLDWDIGDHSPLALIAYWAADNRWPHCIHVHSTNPFGHARLLFELDKCSPLCERGLYSRSIPGHMLPPVRRPNYSERTAIVLWTMRHRIRNNTTPHGKLLLYSLRRSRSTISSYVPVPLLLPARIIHKHLRSQLSVK